MGLYLPINEEELRVARHAVELYRNKMSELKEAEKILSMKKFHFGDIARKVTPGTINDMISGCSKGSIGKVIGYDTKNDRYILYCGEHASYVYMNESDIELVVDNLIDGIVSDDIKKFNPYSNFELNLKMNLKPYAKSTSK